MMSKRFPGVNVCNMHFDELDSDAEESVLNCHTHMCICARIGDDILHSFPSRSVNSIDNRPLVIALKHRD